MKYKTAIELIELYKNKKLTVASTIEALLNKIKESDFYTNILQENIYAIAKESDILYNSSKERLLEGLPFVVEDNLAYEKTAAGTKFLENYISPFEASIIKNLKDNGALILAKTKVSELGLALEENVSGVGKAVLDACIPLAVASDAGGYLVDYSNLDNLISYLPSQGLISRHGLITATPALDRLGFVANCTGDLKLIFNSLKTSDDATLNENIKFFLTENNEKKSLKILIPKELKSFATGEFNNFIQNKKLEIVEESFPLLKMAPFVYEIISSVEAFSSLNKFNGFTFGNVTKDTSDNWEEVIIKSRTSGFGSDVKRIILQGAHYSSSENYEKYYLQAVKIRNLIVSELDKIYNKFDLICLPVILGQKLNKFSEDNYFAFAKLAFLPTVTANINGALLSIHTKPFNDNKLFDFMASF